MVRGQHTRALTRSLQERANGTSALRLRWQPRRSADPYHSRHPHRHKLPTTTQRRRLPRSTFKQCVISTLSSFSEPVPFISQNNRQESTLSKQKISIPVSSFLFVTPVSMPWAGEASDRVNSFSLSRAPTLNYNNSCNANGNALHNRCKFSPSFFVFSYSDFLHGLSTPLPASPTVLLRASERLRLVYSYVTDAPDDGGLGINPENGSWSRIESIMTLHDPEFNNRWIRALTTTTTTVGHGQLDAIRTQVCFLHLNTCSPIQFLPRSQVWRGGCSLLCISLLLHPCPPLYLHRWPREFFLRSRVLGPLFFLSFPVVPRIC